MLQQKLITSASTTRMILHPMLEKVRSTSPTVYQEMLKSRLSLVLTIPAGFNFDDLEQVPPVRAGKSSVLGFYLSPVC